MEEFIRNVPSVSTNAPLQYSQLICHYSFDKCATRLEKFIFESKQNIKMCKNASYANVQFTNVFKLRMQCKFSQLVEIEDQRFGL